MLVSKCVIFILHTYCFAGLNLILISEGLIWLEVSNDGPAILGSTIDFYAVLKGDDLKDNYLYKFQQTKQPAQEIHCGINCTYSIHLTTPPYETGSFTMTVTVFDVDSFVPREVSTNETSFILTDVINGDIEIFKEGDVQLGNYIPCGKPVNFTIHIHDPNHFFANASMLYFWRINGETQGYTTGIEHTFTKTGRNKVSLTVVAALPEKAETKWGIFDKNLTVQDEIAKINISGETWISHGKMLNLYITYNGSSPFHYCWKIYRGDKPEANFTCRYPQTTISCNFSVNWYIASTGHYYFSTLVGNGVSTLTRSMDIRIFDTSHVPQLSVIIIPITCVILAIIIVVTGIAYYIHQRKRYVVEVADFDFTRPEELAEMTFFERLYNAIRNALTNVRLSPKNSVNYRTLKINYGSVASTSENSFNPTVHVC